MPFQFSVQPPQTINCNLLNATIVLVCGITRIYGNSPITIEWLYSNTGGTLVLNHTAAIREDCCNYIEVAVYEGLTMISDINDIAGQYWCKVTDETNTLLSNVLIIDHIIDYTKFDDCENVLIEKGKETSNEINCNRFLNGLVPILTIETVAITILIISNIIFVVLWYQLNKANKGKRHSYTIKDGTLNLLF